MKLETYEIEKIIEKFKDNIESEKYLVNELGLIPCFILKKNERSKVFDDLHHHDLYEILYLAKGKVLYTIDEQHYELNEGDLVLISPTSLHRLNKVLTPKCERIVINFSNNFINYFKTSNTDLVKIFDDAITNKQHVISFSDYLKTLIEKYLNSLYKLQFSKEFGDDLAFYTRFVQAMMVINKQRENTSNDVIVNNSNKIITDVVNYIMSNLHKKILLSDIANEMSLSVSRLSHLFKEETGISILKFINKKRLILAKELIRKGEHISQLHHQCGFIDNTSFFRAFKKEYGITPKTYLNNYKLSQE